MRALVAALTSCEVEMEGRLHLVRRPTVQQAVTVLAFAEAIQDGDASGWGELRRTVFAWLPLRLASEIVCFEPADLIQALANLLSAGLPDAKRHESDEQVVKQAARRSSWFEVIGNYAAAFGIDPEAVLSRRWTLFVAEYAEIERLRAVRQLENAAWYAGAKLGKMDDVAKRAYPGDPVYNFVEPEIMRDPEWKARQLEVIRKNRQKQASA